MMNNKVAVMALVVALIALGIVLFQPTYEEHLANKETTFARRHAHAHIEVRLCGVEPGFV